MSKVVRPQESHTADHATPQVDEQLGLKKKKKKEKCENVVVDIEKIARRISRNTRLPAPKRSVLKSGPDTEMKLSGKK